MNLRWVSRIGKAILFTFIAVFALSAVVMFFWNLLVPDVFKGPQITFLQAAGLLVLSHLLLRGWGTWRYTNGWRRDRWKHRLEDKLAAMTPEEREKFKQEWRRRCGWDPGQSEQKGETI